MTQSPYYSVDEVAEILRKHPDTIRDWCRSGKLAGARQFGSTWYIPRATIDPPPPNQATDKKDRNASQ